MFNFLAFICKLFFYIFNSKKKLIAELILIKKEYEIVKRKSGKSRFKILKNDKIIMAILNFTSNIRNSISIVKPETVLKWQKSLQKRFWTFPRLSKNVGRPSTPNDIKELILKMKNENLIWGVRKIQGELKKLGIDIDEKTIRNILKDFRRKGKIKKSIGWKRFLKMQMDYIYAIDLFTIDTILNVRYYAFFIISHKTRQIIQFAVTQFPVREFIRQQVIEFENNLESVVYLIHDKSGELMMKYADYNIIDVPTSTKAPNMNAIAERFIGSVRRECLDWFLIFSEKQIRRILKEYITYYNSKRPHQGLNQQTPEGYQANDKGKITKFSILSGLHHHYERMVA